MRTSVIILIMIIPLLGTISGWTVDSLKVHDELLKAGGLVDQCLYQEAITLYLRVLEDSSTNIDKKTKSRLYNNTGFCLFKLGDHERAMQYYQKALREDPSYTICLNNLAAVNMNMKKYLQALSFLKQAYKLDNSNIKVVFNLFVVHYYLKNKNEAARYLKEAFELNEEYTEERLRKKKISQADILKLKRYLNPDTRPSK